MSKEFNLAKISKKAAKKLERFDIAASDDAMSGSMSPEDALTARVEYEEAKKDLAMYIGKLVWKAKKPC